LIYVNRKYVNRKYFINYEINFMKMKEKSVFCVNAGIMVALKLALTRFLKLDIFENYFTLRKL